MGELRHRERSKGLCRRCRFLRVLVAPSHMRAAHFDASAHDTHGRA